MANDAPPDYTITKRVHRNKWIEAIQAAVEGWDFTIHDSVTGAYVQVFLDDAHFTAENMDKAIREALAPIRATYQLGH